MTVSGKINEWLSIILKVGIIGVAVVAALWFFTSIFANVVEKDGGIPEFPPVGKAQYTVLIKATGNVLLTDSYDMPSDGVYVLHGFYELSDGKWRWRKYDVTLNEHYFGEIIIKRRE